MAVRSDTGEVLHWMRSGSSQRGQRAASLRETLARVRRLGADVTVRADAGFFSYEI